MSNKTLGPSIDDTGRLRLLDALETLQKSGCTHQDERQVWCSDWLGCIRIPLSHCHSSNHILSWNFRYVPNRRRSRRVSEDLNASMESKARSATATLRRIKSTRKALEALSSSLEEAVKLVSDQSSNAIRVTGFASLPDEVLTRIFELYHQHEMENITKGAVMASVSSSNVLARICRRFRTIALQITSLWEDICNCHRDDWILNLKGRCENPAVFILYNDVGSHHSVDNLLRLVHPANQWRALKVGFRRRPDWHHFSERFPATPEGGDFASLECLTVVPSWDDSPAQIDDVNGPNETNTPLVDPNSTPGDVDEVTTDYFGNFLSEWNLPKLKFLELQDVLPLKVNCPSLRVAKFEMSYPQEDIAGWDLKKLRGFLQSLNLVESLSFTFQIPIQIQTDDDGDVTRLEAVKFLRLKSFTLSISGDTQDHFLADLMQMMDMTTITELNISMAVWHIGDGNCPLVKFGRPNDWLTAIFNLQHDDRTPGDDRTCMFPNVEKLQIALEDYKQFIPFDIVLDATPRVRDLTLDLPHCVAPTQYHGQGTYYYYRIPPCRYLETIRFKNCDSLPARWTLYFLEKLKRAGGESKFVDIKRIEIEGCNLFKGFKDDFVNVFGDKLVWKA